MNEQNTPRRTPKFFLFLLAVCLGGITMGLGLSAGYAVTRHFLPNETVITDAPAAAGITTVRVNPLVVPIDPAEPSFVDIIPYAQAAVVSIHVTSSTGRGTARDVPGSGSGFVFAKDAEYAFIATNNHVIENTNTISVSLDDTDSVSARIVGYDRYSDVAVIAASLADLEEKGVPFKVASLGDSDKLRMGDSVIAIGNAMGEGQTVTRGIISALSLSIEIPDRRNRLTLDVLQTDAAVNRGNSGGPLINQHGEVIGIVTAKLIGADIEGMGYALPINNVVDLLWDLKETGSVRQTFLGLINPEEISEFWKNLFNMPSTGVIVTEVAQNSPAYDGGLVRNDLIVQFNSIQISALDDLNAALTISRPGDEIELEIYRDGERMQITVVLSSRMN